MKLLPRNNKKDALVIAGIIPGLLVYLIEEYLKNGIENKDIEIPDVQSGDRELILGNVLSLRHLKNYGAARGLLKNNPKLVRQMSVVLTVVVALLWISEIEKATKTTLVKRRTNSQNMFNLFNLAGLSALLGGSISNTKDRIERGFVVDYFSFEKGPKWLTDLVFNISDFAILLGAMEFSVISDILPDIAGSLGKDIKKIIR